MIADQIEDLITPLTLLGLFILLWCVSGLLLSHWDHWSKLRRRFLCHSLPINDSHDIRLFYRSAFINGIPFRSILNMTATNDAFYLSLLLPWRIGHPSLQIPWDNIQVFYTKGLFNKEVQLLLGNEEMVPLRISVKDARRLGLLERLITTSTPEPNFDTLSDEFVKSLKKPE